ncbi:hypothetical protein [Paraburkholderia hayleyella]|uniref:hypothetical protein n=1 Tax=Paraburkholderia hayleyella TaxID=2152889 RepID=UPI001580E9C7|nr:hypothetical protein [Paraburkholderia hayleyella]
MKLHDAEPVEENDQSIKLWPDSDMPSPYGQGLFGRTVLNGQGPTPGLGYDSCTAHAVCFGELFEGGLIEGVE